MTFVKWGMAAALALAMSPAYADHHESDAQKEMTQARQEAEQQKAEASKDAAEKKAEAQKDVNEAKADAQQKMSEADRKAHEERAEAEKKAQEKTADAREDAAKEGREVRASDDRSTTAGAMTGDSKKAPLSATAKETLQKLHASSEMEVGMARIAKDKAQNDKVKDLADKIEGDHKKMADDITELARDRNVEIATHGDMDKNRKHVEQMNSMQGAAFDKHYADMMAKEHRKDIAELRKAQPKLRANKADADVAKLVDDAIEKLQDHEKLAVEAQSALRSDQRQGRRGSSDANRTSPSSTDTTGNRTGTTRNSDTMGNEARPRDAVHGRENTEGTPVGSDMKDGSDKR